MFLNQGNWQVEISLPPHHCAIGIMLASVITAAVPFMFSIVCGLGYLALSSAFQVDIVPRGDFRTGSIRLPLIPPPFHRVGILPFVIPTFFYGRCGLVAMSTIVCLLTGIAAAFSILGASCVFVHDVLEIYIRVGFPLSMWVGICARRHGAAF